VRSDPVQVSWESPWTVGNTEAEVDLITSPIFKPIPGGIAS